MHAHDAGSYDWLVRAHVDAVSIQHHGGKYKTLVLGTKVKQLIWSREEFFNYKSTVLGRKEETLSS